MQIVFGGMGAMWTKAVEQHLSNVHTLLIAFENNAIYRYGFHIFYSLILQPNYCEDDFHPKSHGKHKKLVFIQNLTANIKKWFSYEAPASP